jgi:murein DD-endopeptidase MepM/ murein hydrolase activator NlpD
MKKLCLIILVVVITLNSCTSTIFSNSTRDDVISNSTIEGMLFFDLNGSGFRDKASFTYESVRMASQTVPLMPILVEEIDDFVQDHPNLQDDDLITIYEPALEGFTVCTSKICEITDETGSFSFSKSFLQNSLSLNITDPNSNGQSFAMRFINLNIGSTVVPEYTMEVTASIMETLTQITDCTKDNTSQVCKRNENTLLIRKQILTDTQTLPISSKIKLKTGVKNEIGLMQGLLTQPYQADLSITPIIYSYTDLDHEIGALQDWNGNTTPMVWGDQGIWNDLVPGVYDQHQGTDYAMPIGTPLVAMADGTIINSEGGYPGDYARYIRQAVSLNGNNEVFLITLGHNAVNLVYANSSVKRGQLIALSGMDAGMITTNPHVHVSVWDIPTEIWDQYRSSPLLFDYINGVGIFEGIGGGTVQYENGESVTLDYCPYKNHLFTAGSLAPFSN